MKARGMFVLGVFTAASSFAAAPTPRPVTPAAACGVSAPSSAPSFGAGEVLEFDLDALGAKAGTLTVRTGAKSSDATWPISATVETNTFFSKIRRVHGTAVSTLDAKTLRPIRYVENAVENDVQRDVDTEFLASQHRIHSKFVLNKIPSTRDFVLGPTALDNLGAVFFMRPLPFAKGLPLCFDVFALRRVWRMTGKVVAREHVSLPVGEFEAWHLQGEAVRVDDPTQHREIHLWVSDDARRLPLVMVGSIDLGAIRATLTGFERPMDRAGKRRVKRSTEVPF